MNDSIRNYLASIGEKGGRKSRRKLSSKQAREMVKVRDAKKAFKNFYTSCFWSYAPDYPITVKDVRWVGEQLMKNGGQKAWVSGAKLCL